MEVCSFFLSCASSISLFFLIQSLIYVEIAVKNFIKCHSYQNDMVYECVFVFL